MKRIVSERNHLHDERAEPHPPEERAADACDLSLGVAPCHHSSPRSKPRGNPRSRADQCPRVERDVVKEVDEKLHAHEAEAWPFCRAKDGLDIVYPLSCCHLLPTEHSDRAPTVDHNHDDVPNEEAYIQDRRVRSWPLT
eukprot:CAMPEP_0205851444 /NCGR_PEP_ID=MMETSP1083-20121108/498_1 /ASSEMBLY_ACC=CAM_ASM_000430 /TAXON_ID=97485 /ORGANISM="Prymnesium parvum, Strain Texoma1" /LENGTH=138 /DNA_ID=CAMNT_0053212599 /DNA_START=480 /DNA_END=896 /DNA_ORIENTATION=-